MKTTLRLILKNQLNPRHSWFETIEEKVIYCLFETKNIFSNKPHHIQKIVATLASMRQFASFLEGEGHTVIYYKLDHPENQHNILDNLWTLIYQFNIEHFEYQLPDNHSLDTKLSRFVKEIPITYQKFDSEHFLTERNELKTFFEDKPSYVFEHYYRYLRRKHGLLMDGDQPFGGRWKHEQEPRKRMSKEHWPPKPLMFDQDVSEVYNHVQQLQLPHVGTINPKRFLWPINREQSLELLEYFLTNCLRLFDTFQEAMKKQFWTLYHSRLSLCLNTKMISPLEVVQRAIEYTQNHPNRIKIQQLEGFIKSVVGWREYIRGIYWAEMPAFSKLNYFNHTAPLPQFYTTGETKMTCLQHALFQTQQYGYAHNTQRLMILGNFALLAECHPDEVDHWFLTNFVDAAEWIQLPNTRGLSQFADGGITCPQPNIGSANYVDKTSLYCNECYYSNKLKLGERACPFNALFWRFLDKYQEKLSPIPKMGIIYRNWFRRTPEQRKAIVKQAELWLENIDNL